MESQKTLEGALKYVTQKKKTSIAHKLRSIIEEKKAQETEEVLESIDDEPEYSPPPRKDSVATSEVDSDDAMLKPKPIIRHTPKTSTDESPKPKAITFGKKRPRPDGDSGNAAKKDRK